MHTPIVLADGRPVVELLVFVCMYVCIVTAGENSVDRHHEAEDT